MLLFIYHVNVCLQLEVKVIVPIEAENEDDYVGGLVLKSKTQVSQGLEVDKDDFKHPVVLQRKLLDAA